MRSIVGAGASSSQPRPGRRWPGVGEHRHRRRVERPALAQPEPAADQALVGVRKRRLAEARLHREPLGERRPVGAAGVIEVDPLGLGPLRRVRRLHLGHRRPVEQRALPGDRVGAEAERDQLALLLEPAAHGRERASAALLDRAHGHRAGARRAQEVDADRARRAVRVVDRELEPAQQDRHHVAAERSARGVPARLDLARPLAVAGGVERDVGLEAVHGRVTISAHGAAEA